MSDDSSSLGLRRFLVLLLNLGSLGLLVDVAAHLAHRYGGGWGAAITILLFAFSALWTLVGFWNSVIGFIIARLSAEPAHRTYPLLARLAPDMPITTRTAICLALRNEDVAAAFARLEAMVESVEFSGHAGPLAFHVLSDTNRPDLAQAEERAMAALSRRHAFVHYRRRTDNAGFKAGNLLDFAQGPGQNYDHMIVLDADSLMSADAMLRLVRAMQADPGLGILQTLVVGRPADNAFARIFQFGMRQAMRMQTLSSAWWQGSSGPFWGHNAIIRIRPFIQHCRLPIVPGRPPLGGHVLSHDQVEAALMRAGGYAVRVIPNEFESWEENPPSLPDFLKRDLRWGQGNIQYLRLLPMLRLKPMGTYQLVNAILMYLGAPVAWLMLLVGLAAALAGDGGVAAALGFAGYFLLCLLVVLPRMIGCIDTILRGAAGAYGGWMRLLAGALVDGVFSCCVGPIMLVSQALFVAGLALGRRITWQTQNRDGRHVSVREAVICLWPQMLFGAVACSILAWCAPMALIWALPSLLPCLLAVPFACITAGRRLDQALRRFGLCAVPDDAAPSSVLRRAAALASMPHIWS